MSPIYRYGQRPGDPRGPLQASDSLTLLASISRERRPLTIDSRLGTAAEPCRSPLMRVGEAYGETRCSPEASARRNARVTSNSHDAKLGLANRARGEH